MGWRGTRSLVTRGWGWGVLPRVGPEVLQTRQLEECSLEWTNLVVSPRLPASPLLLLCCPPLSSSRWACLQVFLVLLSTADNQPAEGTLPQGPGKAWPSRGHGLSVSSPRMSTTPPKKPPRLKKWKIPMSKTGLPSGHVDHWGGGGRGLTVGLLFRRKSYTNAWWFRWRKKRARLEQYRRWRWRVKWTGWASVCCRPVCTAVCAQLVERARVCWVHVEFFRSGWAQEGEECWAYLFTYWVCMLWSVWGYQMYTLTQFRVGMEGWMKGMCHFGGHLVIFLSLKNDEEPSVEGRSNCHFRSFRLHPEALEESPHWRCNQSCRQRGGRWRCGRALSKGWFVLISPRNRRVLIAHLRWLQSHMLRRKKSVDSVDIGDLGAALFRDLLVLTAFCSISGNQLSAASLNTSQVREWAVSQKGLSFVLGRSLEDWQESSWALEQRLGFESSLCSMPVVFSGQS